MNTVFEILNSPVGSALVLLFGSVVLLITGRWLHRPGWLTGLALSFVILAAWLLLRLQTLPVLPIFSNPWQPFGQGGADLLWVGDGWNWYISGLILLIGGVGVLLELNNQSDTLRRGPALRIHANLSVHLSILAAGLLFVGSGNLLTAILTWVVMDILVLIRSAVRLDRSGDGAGGLRDSQAKGLSLVGAMLLLIGLLPAGPTGPGQPLQGGILPIETIALMLIAAMIRAGIYPFHLWLLPNDPSRVNLSERLLDHMVPVLSGLWLLGWTFDLGSPYVLLSPEVLFVLVFSLLGSATAAWTARRQANHSTFVLITSAGLAAISGALAFSQGPSALIWPTTAFALGGGLWLIGEQVWEGWGWQIPVSVGALALAGVPFTPGFLTQPSLSRLLLAGGIFLPLYVVFLAAQSLQIAALLRSWGGEQPDGSATLQPGVIIRLLVACLGLGLPLAIAGFFPVAVAAVVNLSDAIPPLLGSPPSVVAEAPVWLTLVLPLLLGSGLVWLRPRIWPLLGEWPSRVSRFTRLEWLLNFFWWGVGHLSEIWGSAIRVLEGAGYMGWVLVFVLMAYLLLQ